MDKQQLRNLCQKLLKLKENLKCSICMDIIEENVELECNHRFCLKCYSKLIENSVGEQQRCPLCNSVITRRFVPYKDDFANKLANFLSLICKQIEGKQSCSIEEIVHASKLSTANKETKKTDDLSEPTSSKEPTSVLNKVPCKDKKSVRPMSRKRAAAKKPQLSHIKVQTKNIQSENEKVELKIDLRRENKPKNISTKSKIENIPVASTSKQDAFDMLLGRISEDLHVNKKGTKRNYTRNKKDKEIGEYQILNFLDSANKDAVLHWLNDTRNKFDRLTQTQNFVQEEEEEQIENIPTLNLASVSQMYRIKKTIRPKLKNHYRTKSLDLETKPKRTRTRLSEGSTKGRLEDYTIEENTEDATKEAKKNLLMHIIEDEYLNKMENELIKTDEREHQVTQSSTSGWQRIENITKTLRKKGRVPRKLNITVQHLEGTKDKKPAEKILKTNVQNENIPLDKVNTIPSEVLNISNSDNVSKAPIVSNNEDIQPKLKQISNNLYDLSEFEQYAAQNIEEFPKKHNDSSISHNSVNSNKENDQDLLNKIKKVEPLNTNSNAAVDLLTTHKKPDNIILIQDIKITELDEIDPYIQPTQKLRTSTNNISKEKEQIVDVVTNLEMDVNSTRRDSQTDTSFDDTLDELQDFHGIMSVLLNNLKKYSENINEHKHLTKRHIDSIRKYLDKLNDMYKVFQINVPVLTEHLDQCTQTELETRDIQVQTNIITYCDSGIQAVNTDICQVTNKCDNSSQNLRMERKNSKISIERSFSSKIMQNEDFAATWEFANFETQEIEKQYLQKHQKTTLVSSTDKDASCNPEKKSVNEEMIHQSIPIVLESQQEKVGALIFSVSSDVTKNTAEDNFKRGLSDSDSSDIVPAAKRRRNRFIRDDLSIEFVSAEKPKQRNAFTTGLSPATDEENDEEYLNKILKKYVNGAGSENSSHASNNQNLNIERENFDNMVVDVEINEQKLTKSGKSSDKTALQAVTHSLNDDNLFLNDQNLCKIDNDVKKYNDLKENSENSDIIADTESIEPSPKRSKTKKSTTNVRIINVQPILQKSNSKTMNTNEEGFNSELSVTVISSQDNRNASRFIKPIKETYCQELEDSFDSADFDNIVMAEKENPIVPKSNEEDLFSEDDVVESTPPKENTSIERRSQSASVVVKLSNRFPTLNDVDKDILDNFDVHFASLSPPPGFADDNDLVDPEEITVIHVDKQLSLSLKSDLEKTFLEEIVKTGTPDILSQEQTRNVEPITPHGLNAPNIRLRDHSTPLTQTTIPRDTLGLSPIVQEKSIFEKAAASNTVLSNVNQDTPRKYNILTSLPKQKSILNYVKPSQSSNSDVTKRKPCIACTRLSKDQIQSISLLVNKKLATYSAKFNESVTHMIVTLDETKRIKDYTMKFVSAVASGVWIVGFDWIQQCLKTNTIVAEDPYEALDDIGCSGPKMARLNRAHNPLFENFKFFCVSPLYSTTVEDIEDVIARLGGITVRNLENLKDRDGKIHLIITEGRSTQDFEIYEKWLEKFKIATVDIEWLSRSVGRYKILSIRPYIWCSDDILDDIGYPAYLTEHCSSSSEQF